VVLNKLDISNDSDCITKKKNDHYNPESRKRNYVTKPCRNAHQEHP
jgi:hypothetical protein